MLEPELPAIQLANQVDNLADQIRAGLKYRVIELIINGYRKMSTTGHFNVEWKENKFSAVLTGCTKKYCQEFSKFTHQTWTVVREFYHDDEDVISGESDPDKVPRIDIVIQTWTPDYEEMRFPFECKLVDEHRSDLIRLYVEKGIIDRFLTEKDYTAGSSWGGMIGYILHGNHNTIVVKLNEQINRQLNSPKAHLNINLPVANFQAIYNSVHLRPKKNNLLTITHLLLSFPKTP